MPHTDPPDELAEARREGLWLFVMGWLFGALAVAAFHFFRQ